MYVYEYILHGETLNIIQNQNSYISEATMDLSNVL